MKFTDNAMSVHLLRRDNGGYQTPATPADLIACLRANPEAASQVLLALESQYIAGEMAKSQARAEQAERELAEAKHLIAEAVAEACGLAADDITHVVSAATNALRRLARERDEAREEARLGAATLVCEAGLTRQAHATITALRARLAKTERVVEAARGAWKAALAGDPIGPKWAALGQALDALDALRALDSPVGVAATACEHKRQRCKNDHAVCRDCGAVNRAVTGVADWGPPETAREVGSTGAVAGRCGEWLEAAGVPCALPLRHSGVCDPYAPGMKPPTLREIHTATSREVAALRQAMLTRAELVAAVRAAASAVGGPPRRALDALAEALEGEAG